jgi:hypothetical protein
MPTADRSIAAGSSIARSVAGCDAPARRDTGVRRSRLIETPRKIVSILRFIRVENARGFLDFLRRFRNGKHFNSRRDSIDALKNR